MRGDPDDDWRKDALCVEVDGDLFFPEPMGGSCLKAIRICRRCEVQTECLEFALENDLAHGVFGGTSALTRKRMKQERKQQQQQAS